jgi:transcriptional regulator with XRE-family HTH domain|tara:strand:- start:905 stop:1111 length:207 start_codon:yes stop_codon:yes gene_type:complete
MVNSKEDFKKWRKQMGYNQQEVADIFGLKTRMSISYIESGKQKISPSIKIACEYLWNQKHNVCICGKR